MKRLLPTLCLLAVLSQLNPLFAQIRQSEVVRIINVLAADDMMGRQAFTPYADKAAAFIADEFKRIGLKKWNKSYLQTFPVYQVSVTDLKVTADGKTLSDAFASTTEKGINWTQDSGIKNIFVGQKDNLQEVLGQYRRSDGSAIIWVHSAHKDLFSRFASFMGRGNRSLSMEAPRTVVYVMSDEMPTKYQIQMTATVNTQQLSNVVGYIKGKRKKEYVLFSGHYDHLGVRKPVGQDSIANGANDDASGTTAVITLAEYFKKQGKPERSILFVAFTAEESGGYGSRYFSNQLDPDQIVAMFNIEMIGKPATDGPNSAWITGFDKSDFGQILQKAVKGTPYKFYADPYPTQNLFYRSDNATLARLGVPAHSISTTPIDVDQDYHQVSDEVETLDMEHLTNTIKAIAAGAATIISGKETPTR
ncbi:MAG: M20/M25/M40 family metallo-hydrolase, partial [Sinomicrobium sp.]|nr:M20/M25/M40 family metallo-hydrolase [Sinomicrobium sp.]